MTQIEALAKYAARASFEDLSAESRRQLPIHILDSVGCCIAALGADTDRGLSRAGRGVRWQQPMHADRRSQANPIYAAFWHTALVRYVDFMDNFLAQTETCHTADNFGVALTIADYVGGSGRDLMIGVALGYTVQSRFVDHANFMSSGFDHTAQLAFSHNAAGWSAARPERAADWSRHRDGRGQRCVLRRRSGKATVAVEGSGLGAVGARCHERVVPGPSRSAGSSASY